MSLSLLQGYSSAEEEEDEDAQFQNSSDDDDEAEAKNPMAFNNNNLFDFPKQSVQTGLPSAFDAFSEITGPPGFLNNSVEVQSSIEDVDQMQRGRHGGRRNRKDRKNLPAGCKRTETMRARKARFMLVDLTNEQHICSVVEAKAQLVGMHERVRSDIEGNSFPTSSVQSHKGSVGEAKRVATATNPNAEDAADLLRMCLQCGIPKTYSNARGMVCPVCGDRPPADPNKEAEKKKGSTVKDKEKSKRMKGQSSHATWKSETEMQLRQQFD